VPRPLFPRIFNYSVENHVSKTCPLLTFRQVTSSGSPWHLLWDSENLRRFVQPDADGHQLRESLRLVPLAYQREDGTLDLTANEGALMWSHDAVPNWVTDRNFARLRRRLGLSFKTFHKWTLKIFLSLKYLLLLMPG